MAVVLIVLTFDTVKVITAGHSRVPAYEVINKRIYYRMNTKRQFQEPVIGDDAPLFGKMLSPEEAEAMVSHGKMTFQARNCASCHTILGNGAYYAPDLTKAWLDPAWAGESAREDADGQFLMDPTTNARGYGSNRRMPNLHLTEEEAQGRRGVPEMDFGHRHLRIPAKLYAHCAGGRSMSTAKLTGSAALGGGQRLAVKYFAVAIVLFGAQILFGLLAGFQYLQPDFLYGVLDFSVNRMVHINAMVVWMLFGFIGSIYWLIEEESGTEVVGLTLGNLGFWLFTARSCRRRGCLPRHPDGRRHHREHLVHQRGS